MGDSCRPAARTASCAPAAGAIHCGRQRCAPSPAACGWSSCGCGLSFPFGRGGSRQDGRSQSRGRCSQAPSIGRPACSAGGFCNRRILACSGAYATCSRSCTVGLGAARPLQGSRRRRPSALCEPAACGMCLLLWPAAPHPQPTLPWGWSSYGCRVKFPFGRGGSRQDGRSQSRGRCSQAPSIGRPACSAGSFCNRRILACSGTYSLATLTARSAWGAPCLQRPLHRLAYAAGRRLSVSRAPAARTSCCGWQRCDPQPAALRGDQVCI